MAGKNPIFSEEWVQQNPWMDKANKDAEKEDINPQSYLFQDTNSMCMFVNFPDGIPVPSLRKKWDEKVGHEREQQERLMIFNSMLKEKSIRPGMGSVGEKHNGWGNGKQK